jgi:hypothetical protein
MTLVSTDFFARLRRLLISFIYMLDFLNEDASGSGERTRFRAGIYYAVVFIENVLLVSLWSTNIKTTLNVSAADRAGVWAVALSSFAGGLAFMLLYYRLFHVNMTKPPANATASSAIAAMSSASGDDKYYGNGKESSDWHEKLPQQQSTVFNCALNPVLKKKKIPRVIPPLPPGGATSNGSAQAQESPPLGASQQQLHKRSFWKEQNGHVNGYESASSERVREKLVEKRKNETSYLHQLTAANAAAVANYESLKTTTPQQQQGSQFSQLENYSSGDQGTNKTRYTDWANSFSHQ